MAEPNKEYVGWAPPEGPRQTMARVNSDHLVATREELPEGYVRMRLHAYAISYAALMEAKKGEPISVTTESGKIEWTQPAFARLVVTQEVGLNAMGLSPLVTKIKVGIQNQLRTP